MMKILIVIDFMVEKEIIRGRRRSIEKSIGNISIVMIVKVLSIGIMGVRIFIIIVIDIISLDFGIIIVYYNFFLILVGK